MAFRLATLRRTKAGGFLSRIGIPQDVRDEWRKEYRKGWEERFNLGPGQSLAKAKVLFAEWHADILRRREAHAFASKWYRWFVARREDMERRPKLCGAGRGTTTRLIQGRQHILLTVCWCQAPHCHAHNSSKPT
jgi:hypothetical protein